MALEEKTHLASVEILFPSGTINARWDTVIARDGEAITVPTYHRRAFPAESLDEIMAEITQVVSAEYVNAVAALNVAQTQTAAMAADLEAKNSTLQQFIETSSAAAQRITALESTIADGEARNAELSRQIAQLQQELVEVKKPAAQEPGNG